MLPLDALVGYSVDWLAPSGEVTVAPESIKVYSLGCGACIEELSAISQGFAPAPSLFMFATFSEKDREVTLPLLALGLSPIDPKTRRSNLMDLLQIYTSDPDHYRDNPSEWRTAVESSWPAGSTLESDSLAKAFATNLLDMQDRLLALADKMGTPETISLTTPTLAPAAAPGSDRYKALIATLSLSWLRPSLDNRSDAAAIQKRARSIDPLKTLNADQWRELEAWAMDGAYWIWGGSLGPDTLTSIIDWQAQYHLLPDNEVRRDRFQRWLDDTIERAGKGPLSPLEAFGIADIDALASPAWGTARSDARQQLVLASFLGPLAAGPNP